MVLHGISGHAKAGRQAMVVVVCNVASHRKRGPVEVTSISEPHDAVHADASRQQPSDNTGGLGGAIIVCGSQQRNTSDHTQKSGKGEQHSLIVIALCATEICFCIFGLVGISCYSEQVRLRYGGASLIRLPSRPSLLGHGNDDLTYDDPAAAGCMRPSFNAEFVLKKVLECIVWGRGRQ